jgi:hypothetical protein
MANPLIKWYDIGDALRVAMRVVHETAGELSHPMAIWALVMAAPR